MAGKAGKKDKEKAQIERFKAKAKELGADESSEAFDRTFDIVLKNQKPPAKSKD